MMGYLVMDAAEVQVLQGEPKRFGSSEHGERHFCPDCGSALFFSHHGRAGTTIVTAGSLDDFASFVPDVHIWTENSAIWFDLPAEVPRFPRSPRR